jgi:hypothetical protein
MSDQTQEQDWMDKLSDEISEMLANPKLVKFNTHKNRKLFTGQLLGIIKEAINKNTIAKPDKPTRSSTPTITRPNPNKENGFAIMTESDSQRGDDVRDNIAKNKRAGVRSW